MLAFSRRLKTVKGIYHFLYPSWTHTPTLQYFATKGYAVSNIIRWNKENKILFGPIKKESEKKTGKTETAKRSRKKRSAVDDTEITSTSSTKHRKSKKSSALDGADSEETKTTKQQKKTKAKKKDPVDEAAEQRLKEMYLTSLAQPAPQMDLEKGSTGLSFPPGRRESHTDATTVVEHSAESDLCLEWTGETGMSRSQEEVELSCQEEVVLSESGDGEYFPEERTNEVHIPKVLPMPGTGLGSDLGSFRSSVHSQSCMSLQTENTSQVPVAENTEDRPVRSAPKGIESKPVPSALKELNFVLQCPVQPPESEGVLPGALEFKSVIDRLGLKLLPTVNMVLNKTRSELSLFFLQRWRQTMIKELGEEGFRKHQEGVIWNGTNLHACVQQYLSGVPLHEIQVQESNQGHWASIASVLPDVTEVLALETPVSHPWLFYRGTFDCVAKYKDVLYVIDWKTSSKPKPLLSNLYDNPLQVAAYLGAVNLSAEFTSKFGVVDHAAIVVAYQNGQPAHVHRMKPAMCQHYWSLWCQRLHHYWALLAAEKGLQSE